MSEAPSHPANKRPLIITIICIIGFISFGGGLLNTALHYSTFAAAIGSWYPPYDICTTILALISFIGLWQMRLWGLYLYLALVIMIQIVTIAIHSWSPFVVIIPIVIIVIGFSYRSRMR
jgi:hypothetical protein